MLISIILSTLFAPGLGQLGQLPEISKNAAIRLCRDLGNRTRFQDTLKPLLVPRIVDTPQHKKVREYIHDFFASLGWSTELDSFSDKTPLGMKNFHNLIVSLDDRASKHLVLACHYDSKIIEGQTFIGATDSAVPCSIMMDLAWAMTAMLRKRKDKTIGLKMVFFDGEEAFAQWTDEDSLYGSRHLAQKWKGQLDKITVMMLLDLLGTENPRVPNREYGAEGLFTELIKIEEDVLQLGCRETIKTVFTPVFAHTRIEDDHKPFLKKGVPILHLISAPFPTVWHDVADDESALHYPTIDHFNSILRIFIAKYFNITGI